MVQINVQDYFSRNVIIAFILQYKIIYRLFLSILLAAA